MTTAALTETTEAFHARTLAMYGGIESFTTPFQCKSQTTQENRVENLVQPYIKSAATEKKPIKPINAAKIENNQDFSPLKILIFLAGFLAAAAGLALLCAALPLEIALGISFYFITMGLLAIILPDKQQLN